MSRAAHRAAPRAAPLPPKVVVTRRLLRNVAPARPILRKFKRARRPSEAEKIIRIQRAARLAIRSAIPSKMQSPVSTPTNTGEKQLGHVFLKRTMTKKQYERLEIATAQKIRRTKHIKRAMLSHSDKYEPGASQNTDVLIQLAIREREAHMTSAYTAYLSMRSQLEIMLGLFYASRSYRSKMIEALSDTVTKLQRLSEKQDNDGNTRVYVEKRKTLLRLLHHDQLTARRNQQMFARLAHDYRALAKHTKMDKQQLDHSTYVVRTRKLALDVRVRRLERNANELRQTLKSYGEDVLSPNHQGYIELFRILESGIISHYRTTSIIRVLLERSTSMLQSIALVERDELSLSHTYLYVFMRQFYNLWSNLEPIKQWVHVHWRPLLPCLAPYSNSLTHSFAHIDKQVPVVLVSMSVEIQADFSEFRAHMMKKTYALSETGAFSPFAKRMRKHVVSQQLEKYAAKEDGMEKILKSWGYRPSKWLHRLRGKVSDRNHRRNTFVKLTKYYVGNSPIRGLMSTHLTDIEKNQKPHALANTRNPKPQAQPRRTERPVISQLKPAEKRADKQKFRLDAPRLNNNQNNAIQDSHARQARRAKYQHSPADTHNLARPSINQHVSFAPVSAQPVPLKKSTSGEDSTIFEFKSSRATKEDKIEHRHPQQVIKRRQAKHQPMRFTKNDKQQEVGSDRTTDNSSRKSIWRLSTGGRSTSPFKPSPSVKAPHSMPFFIGKTTSEQNIGDAISGLNEHADGEGAQGTHSGSSASDSSNANQGATPLDNSMPKKPNPPPSNDTGNTSDPEQSESEENSRSESEPESESESESEMESAKEEYTPLSFQIPPETLRTALQARPNMRAAFWSHKLYRGLNDEKILLHYCRTFEVAERVAKHFMEEKAVGFDIEWKAWAPPVSIKGNASLIQLACEDRIALFHIALFNGRTAKQLVPPTLKAILESPDILKVGVAVKSDFTRLKKHLDINARGVLELSRIHNLVVNRQVSHKIVGLANQVQAHLLLPLHKGESLIDEIKTEAEPRPNPNNEGKARETEGGENDEAKSVTKDKSEEPGEGQKKASVRQSDWTKQLDDEQMHYAATDAYAGFRLYDVLEFKRKSLNPIPPLPRLCDDDATKERKEGIAQKTKSTKKSKVTAVKIHAEATSKIEEQDADDTQEYETAPEELEETEEEEDEDSQSESEPWDEESESSDDCDAEYIPSRPRRTALKEEQESVAASSRVSTRRVGRLNLSKLTNVDPGYPTLPTLSFGESDSKDSGAFDVLAAAQSRGHHIVETKVEQESLETNDDEFADPELEDALMDMDIDALEPVEHSPLDGQIDNGNITTVETAHSLDQINAMDLTHGPRPSPLFTPLASTTTTHTPEYILATSWAHSYLTSTIPSVSTPSPEYQPSSIRATITHLRAYHLWHHSQIALEDIGTHLRDPPLATSTVSNYILQAVSLEKVEYRGEALREVLEGLPRGVRIGRWKWLSQRVGIVG